MLRDVYNIACCNSIIGSSFTNAARLFACAQRGSVARLPCVTYAFGRLLSVYIRLSY